MAGLLDSLLESLMGNTQFADFLFDKPEVAIDASTPAPKGQTFVLKKTKDGGVVRLARPANQPFTQGERQVGFEDLLPAQQEEDLSTPAGPSGFNILNKLGQVTGLGSPLWAQGLDIDLKRGDPVPSPVSGMVDFVGPRGGFGNQVRIKDDMNREWWLSHLDAARVKPGQRINAGDLIGLGGATGNVIPGAGGDGSHLDLTLRENNKFVNPSRIRDLLNTFG